MKLPWKEFLKCATTVRQMISNGFQNGAPEFLSYISQAAEFIPPLILSCLFRAGDILPDGVQMP